ncbi:MAG TPA: hypothetical protein VM370_02110 [Candidatus Thermoplasmatota archaeon]|nr:hypothetical protein [Candidatus Thermoplasmatota archaeon]
MRNTHRLAAALGAILVLTFGHAAAFECAPTTTQPDATIDLSTAGGATYYVDDLCTLLGFATDHLVGCGDGAPWVYEETNSIAGLQRGDEVVDDTCGGIIPRDTIIL